MSNDNLIRKPFETKFLDEEKNDKDVRITIRLNPREQEMLKEVKTTLEQPKDSTALKTMFYLAHAKVIQDQFTSHLINTIFKNKRNNYRTGAIVEE